MLLQEIEASSAARTGVLRRYAPLALPLALALLLFFASFLPRIQESAVLVRSFRGASIGLLVWLISLAVTAIRSGRVLSIQFIPVRSHYVQAVVHTCVYLYWGRTWHQIYLQLPLIYSQMAFLYALDMLLSWSRRDKWTLGFGPFPIVYSTNLFLQFHDDWFYLQFLMVAVGVFGKEFIRWQKEGRSAHVFNPSGLSLTVASLGLILTGSTDITWGREIAQYLAWPPHIYLVLFLLGLPGQFFFSVTLMTLSAAVTMCLFNLVYTGLTGVYFFFDSNIPIAVFLGFHLLVTDPATSPKTNLGRVIFGSLYGAGVCFLYWFLDRLGVPTFYDKLLPVPILNLSVRWIDRLARSHPLGRLSLASLGIKGEPKRLNLVHMGIWVTTFTILFLTHFVDGPHPGARLEFWRRAAEEGRVNASRNLVTMLRGYCEDGVGSACNELGLFLVQGKYTNPNPAAAAEYFARASDLGADSGSVNLVNEFLFHGGVAGNEDALARALQRLERSAAKGDDARSAYLLGCAHQSGQGVPLDKPRALELFQIASDLGDPMAAYSLARMCLDGDGVPKDYPRAAAGFQKACEAGNARSCALLGFMYHRGDGVPADEKRARALLQRARELGLGEVDEWLKRLDEEAAGSKGKGGK